MGLVTLTSRLGVLWIEGGTSKKERLTKVQATEDSKDKPHGVVQRQDCVDHIIGCDPTQSQHPCYLQHPLVGEDGGLGEPWGEEGRGGVGQVRKLRSLRLWKDGQRGWVFICVQRINSKGQGFSGCLPARGRVLAPTIQITLAVNVGARGHNSGARRVSEAKFEGTNQV